MSVNGKEFAEAKAYEAAREDYNDRWLACVAQWRRVLRQLSLSDLVACYASADHIAHRLADLRMRVTLQYGPTGDHELIDMIVQLQDRLEAYELEAKNAMQKCALAPNIYRDEPAAFLKALMQVDGDGYEDRTVDIAELRRRREEERMQWEAERPDWHPEYEGDT